MQKMDIVETDELTETEAELYDRQIRLWGLESQKRLRTAKVLICGLTGLGAEITKNVLLSGVNYVRLQDDLILTKIDFCAQFLVLQSDLGKNRAVASLARAQKLNPSADIDADTEPLSTKEAEYFRNFNVVILCGIDSAEILRINDICREENVKMFVGDLWGSFGYTFADLQEHTFIEDVVKHKRVSPPGQKLKIEIVTSQVQRQLSFPPFSVLLNFNFHSTEFKKHVKRNGAAFTLVRILQQFRNSNKRNPSFDSRTDDLKELRRIRDDLNLQDVLSDDYFEMLFAELSPVAAIVGGVLAQEVIKVISQKEAPHCNVFLYNPLTNCGFIEAIGV